MNKVMNLCTDNYLIISHYFQLNWGLHYPKEVALLIILAYFKLFRISIKCGDGHNMLLIGDELYVWGRNYAGQLGLGHNLHINYPQKLNLKKIKKISCGGEHSMALTITNKLYVWGKNDYGQLGLGHNRNINHPKKLHIKKADEIVKIICGCDNSTVITASNCIYVWGKNEEGQLGLGHNENIWSPQRFVLGHTVKKIAFGHDHSMALTMSNEIYIWGGNSNRQLGLGHNLDINLPRKISLYFDKIPIRKIICGFWYSMVVTDQNEVYVWGENDHNRLGSCDDEIIYFPQKLRLEDDDFKIKKIACGNLHSIAIVTSTNDLDVCVWGHNAAGQLGLGAVRTVSFPRKINLPIPAHSITKIACGDLYSIVITSSNKIYVWGKNNYGQLGLGHNSSAHTDCPQELVFKSPRSTING
jgi:X-linked retinitis pigmentosa GTPase regulator